MTTDDEYSHGNEKLGIGEVDETLCSPMRDFLGGKE